MLKKSTFVFYVFLSVLIFLWMIQLVQGEMPSVDEWTRSLVSTFTDTAIFTFFGHVTWLGGRTFLIPFTTILSLFLWGLYKNVTVPLFFGLGTLGGYLVNVLIKEIIQRERPSISVAFHAEGFSFPSGHAMNAIVCFSLLTYYLTKKMHSDRGKIISWTMACLVIFIVGISRYVINVHYVTDVIAGFYFGSLYVFILLFVYRKTE